MYHVLVFQQKGKYVLDSVSDQEEIVEFSSLDDLILFLTGHNLKVGEDEVQLSDICSCADDSLRISSNCRLLFVSQFRHRIMRRHLPPCSSQ